MLRLIIFIGGVLSSFSFCSLNAAPSYHRDIHTLSVGVQDKRTEIVFFPDETSALSYNFERSPFYLNLNGEWDFQLFDSFDKIPSDLSSLQWGKITVPGNWDVQGWSKPVYFNKTYGFSPNGRPVSPNLPKDIPAGVYRRSFEIPEIWEGREVYLNVCGAKSGVYAYINGQFVSYSEDAKSLARIDITPLLKEGENEVVLVITRWSTGSYLECQDFWRLNGIERDVYLSSEIKKQDFDYEIVSSLDDKYESGLFQLSSIPGTSFRLFDGDRVVLEGQVPFKGTVPAVRKWSAETPELYTLLLEKDGEFARADVGFRRTEIKDEVFYFNGQPIKFKGVNLHEHNQYTGHYTDREYIRENLLLMKKYNINAIRTCHYPQPRAFYELCDSLGFYVYDEANIESHGMGYGKDSPAKHPEWFAAHADRVMNMYMRTRNYPCVTVFSLGNEAGNGINFERCYDILKAMENGNMNRPVVYNMHPEKGYGSDFLNPTYPTLAAWKNEQEHSSGKPFIPCEYSHAMGNSNGSFDLIWQFIYSHKRMQGGFIWDWVDQGLAATDARGKRYWEFGDAPDWNFNCNGLVNPDLDPHPALVEVKHWYQNVEIVAGDELGEFVISNRNYFRSLGIYEFRYELFCDGMSYSSGKLRFDTEPQSSELFRIDLPAMKDGHCWYVNFYALNAGAQPRLEAGFALASDQIILVHPSSPIAKQLAGNVKIVSKKGSDTGHIVLKARRSKLVFDAGSGRVLALKSRGKHLIDKSFGLRPEFWRAPVDNDWGDKYPLRAPEWKADPAVNKVQTLKTGNSSTIKVDYSLPKNCVLTVLYSLTYAGDLKVVFDFKGSCEEPVEVQRIGFRTRMKPCANKFRYFGRGPEENYVDRNTATFLGLYEGTASESIYPYVRPQESGHHTCCEWLEIGQAKVLCVGKPFEFSALRMSVEDLDPRDEEGSRIRMHVDDIEIRDYVELCIDGAMSGVGGYNSWGILPEPSRTLFSNQDYSFSFVLGRK